jgi:NADH:ubiquinone oxidoreductase subunit F (NADH-binding)
MRLSEFTCCERCVHSSQNPCPMFIECLNGGPGCHDDEGCVQARKDALHRHSRTETGTPVVFVGTGTCGLGAGAGKTLAAVRGWLETAGVQAAVVETGCVGLCSVEPIMDVLIPGRARVSFQNVTAGKVPELLASILGPNPAPSGDVLGQYRTEGAIQWEDRPYLDEHPFFAPQTRRVLEHCGVLDPSDIDEYLASEGYLALSRTIRTMTPQEVCSEIEKSGLRGRGGGGFPTGRKWKVALSAASDVKYMICNADEGDPGAFMDRAVIEGDPHRVLEGLAIASYAIGASKAFIYIRAEYPLAITRLRTAIEQAREHGFLGTNIMDSGFDLDITIKKGAGAFVCGEETALIKSIEGRRGMPIPRPPYPAEKGLFGRPTIINNVETLANVPGILLNGADWFASIGTKGSRGTKVFALSGKITNTGLVEVAMGTRIRDILFGMGGGIPGGKAFKAVQIGGPSGGCIPQSHIDIEVDYESLTGFGAMMGSGGLVVMDEDTCMVDMARFFMDFIRKESCGKCIPCREGTRRMLDILDSITRGRRGEKDNDALERFHGVLGIESLGQVIRKTSLCGLGQTAPNPVLSTMKWFRDEYEAHIFERRCPAGACIGLLSFSIDPAKCRGCTVCARKCPSDAIMGALKSPHYIIPEKCIGCGACMEACPFCAVTVR